MSEIQRSVQLLADVLVGKNQDYTANRGEFYNFEETAKFVGGGMDPLSVMLTQLGIKITRLDSLRLGYDERVATNFEGIKDTLLDLAGYAIIAHAYLSAQGRVENHLCTKACDYEGCPG
jgi:hypothetical protein